MYWINLIGSSGGALAAINVALENPELVSAVIADSFEGMKAKPDLTEQICIGRNYAKQNEGFCSMLKSMHGEDWENVLDADTDAVVRHAKNIGDFFHKSLSELQTKMLLTGSARDEMFQEGHYQELFDVICQETNMVQTHIFEQGGHPAIISNMKEFGNLCEQFFV